MSKQKLTSFLRPVSLILIFLVFSSFLFLMLAKAQFVGPTGSAGSAPGAIGVDASKNLSVGTSTTQTNTKFLIVSSSTDSSNFGLKILQSNANPAFVVRNDGSVGVGTSTPNSATLTVSGTIYSSGNYTGTINAPNVSAGVFGAGNFAFPSSLGVATSSQVSLPQSLSVYGGGYFSGNVGIGTTGPAWNLDVNPSAGTANIQVKGTSANLLVNHTAANSSSAVNFRENGVDKFIIGTGVYTADVTNFDIGTNAASLVRIQSNGNVGIGLTTPGQKLEVAGNVSSTAVCLSGTCNTNWPVSGGSVSTSSAITAGYFPYWANTAGGLNGTSTIYLSGANVGIGTTSPTAAKLQVAGDASAVDLLSLQDTGTGGLTWRLGPRTGGGGAGVLGIYNGSAQVAAFGASNSWINTGNVGIGTTAPGALLQVGSSAVNSGVAGKGYLYLPGFNSINDGLYVDRNITNEYGWFNFQNGATSIGARGGTSSHGWIYFRSYDGTTNRINMVIDNSGNVGIGTTGPGQKLEVAGNVSSTAVCLSGTCNTSWPVSSGGGSVSTSSAITAGYFPYWANATGGLNGTSTIFLSGGNVGIATTTPQALLSVGNNTSGLVAVFGGGTGKITVGTVDPVYTIGGTKYATYSPETTGVKVETTGVAQLTACQAPSVKCQVSAVIDFNNLEKGSDLWLFGKTTNLKNNFDKLAILLTPSFDGRVWYEKDAAKNILKIYAFPSAALSPDSYEVSYRLSAPRFDSALWPNTANDASAGFIIDEK